MSRDFIIENEESIDEEMLMHLESVIASPAMRFVRQVAEERLLELGREIGSATVHETVDIERICKESYYWAKVPEVFEMLAMRIKERLALKKEKEGLEKYHKRARESRNTINAGMNTL
jgi:predicted RNase H-like HicB family nuclease